MRSNHSDAFWCGHSIAEYGLLLFLLALVSVPALNILGQAIEAFYSEGEPVPKAGELFALLDGSAPAAPAGQDDTSAALSKVAPQGDIIAENQPVQNLLFNYEGERVQVLNGAGELTTSAEGTRILAQNLKEILEEQEAILTDEQKEKVTRLADLGNAMAKDQEYILSVQPEASSANPPDMNTFTASNSKADTVPTEHLYVDFKQFRTEYYELDKALGQTAGNPVLSEVKKEIDANAGTISQLAYHNFLKPQLQYDAHLTTEVSGNTVAAGQDLSRCKAKKQLREADYVVGTQTDVSGISREDSAEVTAKSAEEIRKQEKKCWWNEPYEATQ